MKYLLPLVAAALLGLSLQASASTEGAPASWPEKVVAMEQLVPITPFNLRVRGNVSKGKVTGPAIVRAHVDPAGAVVRAVLHASSGNADLDEAALHGMRDMRFKPFAAEGAAVPVTLVAPIHVPKRLGRSD